MTITIRRFEPADVTPVTELLHRAYAPLAARGLNFTAADQSEKTTLYRVSDGCCLLAYRGNELVGTITMAFPPKSGLRELAASARVPRTGWLNQLAVEPLVQGSGVASALWRAGLKWVRGEGATTVGVDTAEPAVELLELYRGWGFAPTEVIQWPGKTYRSVVMTRAVGEEVIH